MSSMSLGNDLGGIEGTAVALEPPRRSADALRSAVCFVSTLFSDAVSFFLAFWITFGLGHVVDRLMTTPPWHRVPIGDVRRSAVELVVSGGIALFYCMLQAHYTRRVSLSEEACSLLAVSVFALITSCIVGTVMHGMVARHLFMGTWLVFPAIAMAGRLTMRRLLLLGGFWQRSVLLIVDDAGEDPDAARHARSSPYRPSPARSVLTELAIGYRIVAEIPARQIFAANRPDGLPALMRMHGAGQLVLDVDQMTETGRRLIRSVVRAGVPFSLLPKAADLPVFGVERTAFLSRNTELLTFRDRSGRPVFRFAKSAADLLIAFLLLVAFAPLMLTLAVLVRLDGGPALFGHERLGVRGRPFKCLKFRTMVVDGDRVLRETLERDPSLAAEWAETRKLTNDPRVTRLGRILRATSLDELPQLLNVLRREMSLVGPRPIVRGEVERYAEDISYYYGARPGLTGLWQVSGRSDTSYEKRVALDSSYVRNRMIWHELAILLKTIPVVLGRQGAR